MPLPDGLIKGKISISATLLIAPEVDPEHPGAYTRSGLEIAFRPNSKRFRIDKKNGKQPKHAKTRPSFTPKNMYRAELQVREEGKWEPCRKYSDRLLPTSFDQPAFDIYYHHRESARRANDPRPIPYAFIIGIHAPKTRDFYARLVRTYSHILVPLRPSIQIQLRNKG